MPQGGANRGAYPLFAAYPLIQEKSMTTFTRLLACVLLLGLGSAADAQLVPRLGGLVVYDVDRDLTWTADANLAETSGWTAVGAKPKFVADQFIVHLNTISFGGVSDWRLPTGDEACGTINCTTNEMGHLFYDELSGTAGAPISTSGAPNLALFSNIQESLSGYWTGTPQGTGPRRRSASRARYTARR